MSFGFGLGFPRGGSAAAWTPASLFTSGEQGAWYDPSDMATLFQDSAGTTPVTAVEQPVGLILDKSKGLVLGSELVTDPGFDNSSYWTKDPGTSVTGGLGVFSSAPLNNGIGKLTPFVTTGKCYQLTYTIVSITSGSLRPYTGGPQGQIRTASGTYTELVAATSGQIFIVAATAGTTATIDNISIKEVTGNHAYQSGATTLMPTLSARYNLLTYTEQFDNADWVRTHSAITPNNAVAPDGTTTACLLYPTTTGGAVGRLGRSSWSGTGARTLSCYVKAQPGSAVTHFVLYNSTNNNRGATMELATGVVTSQDAAYTVASQSVGNGWFRFSVTTTTTFGTVGWILVNSLPVSMTVSGATNGIYIWGASLVPADQASLPYQRVAAATDYDTVGFKPYIYFDGNDDSWVTNSIDFSTATSDGLTRRNLLTFPSAFDDAVWTPNSASITANAVANPIDGLVTADKLYENSTGTISPYVYRDVSFSGAAYTLSVYAKKGERDILYVYVRDAHGSGTVHVGVEFDLTNGSFTDKIGTGGSITPVNGYPGWYRCVISGFAPTAGTRAIVIRDGLIPLTGVVGNGLYLWGAQLETGSTATAFQNIGTDKMTVLAGVRKLSDAAAGFVAELSATLASNNGTFTLRAPDDVTPYNFSFYSKGTASVRVGLDTGADPAPTTRVLTGQGNISGDSAILRINGAQVASSSADQGTGNYGNYPLYIGRRGGTTLPFKGNLYSLIVRGAASTEAQVQAAETYVNTKTGAY